MPDILPASLAAPAVVVAHGRAGGRALAILRGTVAVASRHRTITAAGAIASLAMGLGIAAAFASQSYEASGTLLYAPLTGPDTQGSLYVPPDLKTLVTLAKSPRNLDAIRKEFKLPVPLELLEKSFKVVVPTGTKTVDFQIRWGNPGIAAGLVNRLMDLFRSQVAEVRTEKINGYVDDFKQHVDGCRTRLKAANEALDAFARKNHVGDINGDLGRLNTEVQTLEAELDKARREEVNFVTQLDALDKHMARIRDEDRRRDEDDKKSEAVDETVADNRRRQERLRELIVEERLKMEVGAKLEARRGEMQRVFRLVEKNLASREDYERARAEVAALEAQVKENDRIAGWREELERIDKSIVPKGKTKNTGSAAIQQIVFKHLELELFIVSARKGIDQLTKNIAGRRREIERLMGLQNEHRALSRVVESCEGERQAASAELTALKKLQAIRTYEFAIITPASPAPYAASSNRKALLGGVAGVGTLLTLGLLALGDRVWGRHVNVTEAAWKLGLPILARVRVPADLSPWGDLGRREEPELRLLALRIRQSVPEAGSLILFSSLNAGRGSAWLVASLARCYAHRDERVLIMDLAGHAPDRLVWPSLRARWAEGSEPGDDPAGLHAYLVFECDEPEDFVFPTSVPGVDCMPAGDLLYGVELIATHRMGELMALMRSRYSIILAVGPAADQQVDLEMLSAHAGGLIFHAVEHVELCAAEPSRIRDLRSLGAPVLGAVLGEEQRPARKTPNALPGGTRHASDHD